MKHNSEQKVQQVLDRGIQDLDKIYDWLMEEAEGVCFAVSPHTDPRAKPKPHLADFVAKADAVEKVCKACKQPILKQPPEVWEVFKEKRDASLLKWLADQLIGKAQMRQGDKIDPEIIVVFGDIDSQQDIESGAIEERKSDTEINGSPDRISELTLDKEVKLGLGI